MRIGCLQFAPQVGDIDNNLNRADAVLNKSPDLEDLDLLVLPELAFTGYNFHSLAQISPFLEPSGSGVSSLWARTTALKLNCNVVVGYPEKVDVASKWPTSPEFYNSAIMVNRDGETIANYRKSFLYAVDETWALEGRDGFFENQTPDLGCVAMGICMDLNPYKFEAPWHAFEFAFHVLEVQANLVILTMAWVTRENPRSYTQLPQEPDLETLKYWIQRLEPVIRSENEEEIIFVIANRTGIEEDCVYTGTSTVFGIKKGEVNLYGALGRGVKELLVVDTSRKPFAKVVRDESGEEVDNGGTYTQPPYRPPNNTSGQFSNSMSSPPAHSSPMGPSFRAGPNGRNTMPNGEGRSGRSAMYSIGATHFEQRIDSPTWTAPLRSPPPKLELKIPTDTRVQGAFRNWISPHSGTLSPGVGEPDIPTPTAPSPTPVSLRPKFSFPETHSTLPRMEAAIHPSANKNIGGGVMGAAGRRVDSPITPPLKNSKELERMATIISEKPPSPPTDEELKAGKQHLERSLNQSETSISALPSNMKSLAPYLGVEARDECSITQQTNEDGDAAEAYENIELSEAEMNGLARIMKNIGRSQDDNPGPSSPPTIPVRPPSTKSRNASCSRAEGATTTGAGMNAVVSRSSSQSRMSIPIAASPSVFYREAHAGLRRSECPTYVSPAGVLRGSQPARQENSQEMVEMKNSTALSGVFSGLGTDGSESRPKESTGRPVSRGRQPLTRPNATNGGMPPLSSVSTSRAAAGSTDRGRPPSNNRSIVSRGATSTASSASWLFGTPPPRTQPSLDPDDEIIAMINLISRSCPVHSHSQTQQGQEHQSENLAAVAIPDMGNQPTQTPLAGGLEDSIYEVILPPNIRELVDSLPSSESRNQTPLRGLDIARSRSSPKFDPPTPTAMCYDASLQDEAVVSRVPAVETKQEC